MREIRLHIHGKVNQHMECPLDDAVDRLPFELFQLAENELCYPVIDELLKFKVRHTHL